jgi:hypothetical protein
MQQPSQQRWHGFQPGQSGNPQGAMSAREKQERIEATARELAAEFGGYDALSPVNRTLVVQAATLLLRKPRTQVDAVRVANSIGRLLASVRNRKPASHAPVLPLRERLASEAGQG